MPEEDYVARALSDTWNETRWWRESNCGEYPTQEQRDMAAASIIVEFLRCVPPDISAGELLEKVKEIANG